MPVSGSAGTALADSNGQIHAADKPLPGRPTTFRNTPLCPRAADLCDTSHRAQSARTHLGRGALDLAPLSPVAAPLRSLHKQSRDCKERIFRPPLLQPVFFQFPVQRRTADAEHRSGHGAVTFGVLDCFENRSFLDVSKWQDTLSR